MSSEWPTVRFTSSLPNLMASDDYHQDDGRCKVRVQICETNEGIEIIADSRHIAELESLLAATGIKEMERVLCG